MVQILLTPNPGSRHGVDQVCTREQRNADGLSSSICGLDTATDGVDFIVEVVQDERGRLIFLLYRLPCIHHQPIRGLVHCQFTHCDTIGNRVSTS